jgi:VanZ family protein
VPKKIWFGAAWSWTILITFLCLVSFKKLPSVNVSDADKYVHFSIHFVFTVLWFGYFRMKYRESHSFKIALGVLLLSLLFGIAIELAQGAFTTTRQADRYDVLANFSGALTAAIVLLGLNKLFKEEQS